MQERRVSLPLSPLSWGSFLGHPETPEKASSEFGSLFFFSSNSPLLTLDISRLVKLIHFQAAHCVLSLTETMITRPRTSKCEQREGATGVENI